MNDDQKCKKKMIFGKKHAALPQLQIPNHKQRVFYSVWHGHEQLTALETTKRKELHRHILTGCPWNHFGCQSLKERFFRDTLYLSWVLKMFWSHSSYFPIGHNSISNNCRSERQISPVFLASTIQAAGSISSARRSSKKLNIPSQSLRRIFHSRIQMEMLTQGLLKSLGRSRRASARSASDGSGRRLAFCGRAARRRGQSVTPRLARFSQLNPWIGRKCSCRQVSIRWRNLPRKNKSWV